MGGGVDDAHMMTFTLFPVRPKRHEDTNITQLTLTRIASHRRLHRGPPSRSPPSPLPRHVHTHCCARDIAAAPLTDRALFRNNTFAESMPLHALPFPHYPPPINGDARRGMMDDNVEVQTV